MGSCRNRSVQLFGILVGLCEAYEVRLGHVFAQEVKQTGL